MARPRNRKRINLALQGGGAHGAFTWGVLDRIMDEDDIEIAGISGTSAGALNGAAYKSGYLANGIEGARHNLEWLWRQIGSVGDMRITDWVREFTPAPVVMAQAAGFSAAYAVADVASRMFSPYAYGPFYQHPLRSVVDQFDFGRICTAEGPRFYVCATNVRTGKARVFTGDEISTDAILASACLPTLFQAVEITDPETGQTDPYWDGGYTGNPALFPLYDQELPDDIVVVNINPLERDDLPTTPQDIQNRINEISFNSALFNELRAIHFVKRLIDQGAITPGAMKDANIHMIADDDLMRQLSVATKTVPNPLIIGQLRDAGRAAADKFLTEHKDDLNHRGTADLVAMFG